MIVFEGIQQILAHCLNLINQVKAWFLDIPIIDVFTQYLPDDIISVLTVVIGIILTIGTIGFVKKISFLLG